MVISDRTIGKIWKIHEPNPRLVKVFCGELGISPVLAQLLLNRNIKDVAEAQSFLFGDVSSCHDPFLFKDMGKSVSRIKKAISSKEKILIYGDYDVDGITATALLSHVLDELGGDYETFIPNRLEEGYGLNLRAVAHARERAVKLMITVDCGINAFKEVKCANDCGIDVIVTDHHEIKEGELPPAFSIIDAHQKDCAYPFKQLAGVGVAYKLGRALMQDRAGRLDEHLDLVALGTVADIVPLVGENRILVKAGLKRLKETAKFGLQALMKVARVRPESLNTRHIGFMLAPRINAMGRVGSASVALDLVMTRDAAKAEELAMVLDRENRNRQSIEKDLFTEAMEMVEKHHDARESMALVLAGENWHQGVLGIVASKITEEFGFPAVLISLEGENGKGSARSVEGFNLFEALKSLGGLLVDFGGHEGACGLKIRKENIEEFRTSFYALARKHFLEREEVLPELNVDFSLPFSSIGVKLINEMELLKPYGPDNLEPVFCTSGLRVKNFPRDIGKSGFKFLVHSGSLACEVISFNRNKVTKPRKGSMIDLAYTPSVNFWDGLETIQLDIKDLQVVE